MSLENSERINHRNSPAIHSPSELTDGGHSVTKMQAMMIRSNENMIDQIDEVPHFLETLQKFDGDDHSQA